MLVVITAREGITWGS